MSIQVSARRIHGYANGAEWFEVKLSEVSHLAAVVEFISNDDTAVAFYRGASSGIGFNDECEVEVAYDCRGSGEFVCRPVFVYED